MLKQANRIAMIGVVTGVLALGGCATKEDVEHAQSTADAAMSAAQKAQSTADANTSAVQAAAADAHRANDRLDQMTPTVAHLEHHHYHRTWRNVGYRHHHRHHRHHAKTKG